MGDGYEFDVNEFDFKDDNGICYDKGGVIIRHWRRVHGKDGASAYRFDWNGLSFVWTGDGRPDSNTPKYAKGVDVFVTELQPYTLNVQTLKFGIPVEVLTPTMDVAHTVHYATGCMFKEVQPRLAMARHLVSEHAGGPRLPRSLALRTRARQPRPPASRAWTHPDRVSRRGKDDFAQPHPERRSRPPRGSSGQ
jgi:hypothetical protein